MKRVTSRHCYICQKGRNPIVATEPIEHRMGRRVLPEDTYTFVRCRGCDTLYVDSCVTDEFLHDLYADESVESVAELIGEQGHREIVSLRVPEFEQHWVDMKAARPPQPGDQLLDVGCQTGELGLIVQRDGVRPYGIELSSSYAKMAQTAWGGDSSVHSSSDLSTAPFREGQFAYITALETLEHMCDPAQVLRHLHVWLAADGLLAVSVPSTDYFHLKYWLFRKSPLSRPLKALAGVKLSNANQVLPHTHIYNFSPKSVHLLLEKSGFLPISIGLTGWHGRVGAVMHILSSVLYRLSRQRLSVAPSLFALASRRPRAEAPASVASLL